MKFTALRRLSASTAVGMVAALAAVGVGSAPAMADSQSTATARAACSHLVVTGTVKLHGTAKPRWGVAIALHNAAKPLTGGRADAHGHFAINVCRGSAVRTYAARHSGHVNIDVLAHAYNKRSSQLIRTVSPKLSTAKVVVPTSFVVMATRSPVINARPVARAAASGGVIQTGDSYAQSALVSPPVMYLENIAGITTTYSLNSSTMKSVATTVGVGNDDYGVSGSIELDNDSGFYRNDVLRRPKNATRVAVLVRPQVKASMTYTCRPTFVMMPYYGGAYSTTCSHAMDAAWTGAISRPSAGYVSCWEGAGDPINLNNRANIDIGSTKGVTFIAKGGFKTPFVSADFATTYGDGTSFNYHLNQTKDVHKFCASGNSSTVVNSSRIYITAETASTPPRCRPATTSAIPCL